MSSSQHRNESSSSGSPIATIGFDVKSRTRIGQSSSFKSREKRPVRDADGNFGLEFDTIQEDLREFNLGIIPSRDDTDGSDPHHQPLPERKSLYNKNRVDEAIQMIGINQSDIQRRFHSLKNQFVRENYLKYRKDVVGMPPDRALYQETPEAKF